MKTINQLLSQLESEQRMGLVTHVVIGYPTLEATYELVKLMVEVGVDAIELQIPFSDPLADGATIMHASKVALASGITPKVCFEFAARVSREFPIPFICMTYYNIVHQFHPAKFVSSAVEAGIAGLIIPDVPLTSKEGSNLHEITTAASVPLITVLAPHTSAARLNILKPKFSSMIYVPRFQGVTGARETMDDSLAAEIIYLRQHTKAKILAGFGISTTEQVLAVKNAGSDLVVVGSAVLDRYNANGLSAVKEFLYSARKVITSSKS